ncbi:MAG: hypothetical protein IJS94_00315, partial [Clostridia bacterium]|nr:hypothetical protein [Clostridia bacterium]
MANKKAKSNNAPLAVLLAGLLIVAILLAVYGIVRNRTDDIPVSTDAPGTSATNAGRSSETVPSSNVHTTDTTVSSIEVIATTDVTQTTAASAADTTKSKPTATTAKKTTATEAKTPATTQKTVDDTAYSSIPFYKSQNAERYIEYGKKNPKYTAEQIVTFVNIGLDKKYYTDTKTAINLNTRYILANK